MITEQILLKYNQYGLEVEILKASPQYKKVKVGSVVNMIVSKTKYLSGRVQVYTKATSPVFHVTCNPDQVRNYIKPVDDSMNELLDFLIA